MREEKGDDKTGFCERLLCCICVAVKTAAEGEFPREKSIYQPPKKQSSGTKKTEDSQGTKGSDDQPPRPIGTFNMTLSISIPEKQLESTTTLKAPIIVDKGVDSQAKTAATSKPRNGVTEQNRTPSTKEQPEKKSTSQHQESQKKQDDQDHPPRNN
ncbi:unnamed protein product [Musa textilis]